MIKVFSACAPLLQLITLACACARAVQAEGGTPAIGISTAPRGIPPYVRGPEYEFILSQADLDSGISYLPAAERLRVVVEKLQQGTPVSFVSLGGSITAGQGAPNGPSLFRYVANWFDDHYPGLVRWSNGGVSGTTSAYASVCHNMHVPSDADLIVVEFSINDLDTPAGAAFNNPTRRAFERLLRKLLNYPNRPAVFLLHAYAWSAPRPTEGTFGWSSSECEFGEFERYYHLPSLSTKAAVYHHMRSQVDGFHTVPRMVDGVVKAGGKNFYFDPIHPDEETGCRMMAELVYHLLTKVKLGLLERPLVEAERQRALEDALPPPMIPGNHESNSTRCFIAGALQAIVSTPLEAGWEWRDEGKSPRAPKWGYISMLPGSTIQLHMDTRATSKEGDGEKALVQLAHLKSYEHMGQASVNCAAGCVCEESVMDGHHSSKTSQTFLHDFYVTPAENCTLLVKVLTTTTSGKHKVKLTGLMTSEVAGTVIAFENGQLVESVAVEALLPGSKLPGSVLVSASSVP